MNTAVAARTLTPDASAGTSIATWLGADTGANTQLGQSIGTSIERHLDAHAHLYLEGQRQIHVWVLLEGVVGHYKLLSDGRRQITNFSYPGDLIGLECPRIHADSAEALTDTRVRAIPIHAINRLIAEEPGFGQALLGIAARELADTREQIVSLGRKSAAEKVAGFLLRLVRRKAESVGVHPLSDQGPVIELPMKRSDIADFLGLTIETVSRNITRLRTARIIQLQTSHQVRVIDLERLEAIANGDRAGRLA